jgi:hypothetical protein
MLAQPDAINTAPAATHTVRISVERSAVERIAVEAACIGNSCESEWNGKV